MPTARMRPLNQLDASALRGLRGVLTDIDDTLTHQGAIEPAALPLDVAEGEQVEGDERRRRLGGQPLDT